MAKKMYLPPWKRMGFPTPLQIVVNGKHVCPYRIHRIWKSMRKRVKCPPYFRRDRHYKYYAHVTMCDEWRDFEAFWFWAILTGYNDDLSIDRKDWRKGYTPDNCRWATLSEQSKNRHYTDAFREASRRNVAKARAVQKAMREARKAAAAATS